MTAADTAVLLSATEATGTMPLMVERIRLTFDVPDRVRRALGIFAARTGMSVGEAIEDLVEKQLPLDLELADRSIAEGRDAPGPKRGRRPKAD